MSKTNPKTQSHSVLILHVGEGLLVRIGVPVILALQHNKPSLATVLPKI